MKRSRLVDITGQRFGRLVALSRSDRVGKYVFWNCRCDCGKEKEVESGNLRNRTRSCGCLQEETKGQALTTHGKRHDPIYAVWCGMINRCTNPNQKSYKYYGGRGISVCDEWRTFANFFRDMGEPAPGQSIDRIDVNGNYELSNCRWADAKTQARNKRSSRILDYNGESRCVSEWAEVMGLPRSALQLRLKYGWDVSRALTEPLRDWDAIRAARSNALACPSA